jgi:hypothetical protein
LSEREALTLDVGGEVEEKRVEGWDVEKAVFPIQLGKKDSTDCERNLNGFPFLDSSWTRYLSSMTEGVLIPIRVAVDYFVCFRSSARVTVVTDVTLETTD